MPALHNGLTSNPKLQQAYRRALGEMSQSFSGLERGSESLQPIMDLWSLPEWALLRGDILFSKTVVVAALAANFSALELVNPTGSGVLAVVLEIGLTGASDVETNVDTGPALGVVATNRGVAHDCRFPLLGETSGCTLVSGQFAAGVAAAQDHILTNTRSSRPYVIQPGKKMFIMGTTLNTAIRPTVFWTEHQLLKDEQNP